ncbi:hypothetical protein ACFL6U_15195 [Planctomycetota bacterium]
MNRGYLAVGILLVLAGGMHAQEYELIGLGTRVSGLVDLTAQSQYVWRGFNVYGNRGAAQLTAGVALPEWGPGLLISGHNAIGSGYSDFQRWDISPYYSHTFAAGSPGEMGFRVGYVYYMHPALPQAAYDMQEINAVFAFPGIIGSGFIPSFNLIRMWPAKDPSVIDLYDNAEGYMFVFNFDYIFALPSVVPELPEQVFKFHSEITYNSGFNPVLGYAADTDGSTGPIRPVEPCVSHAVFGAMTDFELGYGLAIPFGIYYQLSLEDSVNPDDQAWATLGLRYSF